MARSWFLWTASSLKNVVQEFLFYLALRYQLIWNWMPTNDQKALDLKTICP
jgi:hypothetical protein